MKMDYDEDVETPEKRVEDDLEWERMMGLSEKEVEAEWQQAMKDYSAWIDGMPLKARLDYERDNALRAIRQNRRRVRKFEATGPECIIESFKKTIARRRLHLVKVREWRRLGVFPQWTQ